MKKRGDIVKYMDVKTAAKMWEISERRITMLCRSGRITGAIKEKRFESWEQILEAMNDVIANTEGIFIC